MLHQFENIIAGAIRDCPPGTVCLAAVSGGADSTAMLVALAAVRDRGAGFDLRCIHVEHGIRPVEESRGDADFVRSLCEKLGVPCRIVSVPPGKIAATAKKRGVGIEAAARLYRRRAWFREAASCGALPAMVLVAHTADDMLETALMRILRGAGPSGLAAMPACRGAIMRPLLTLSRAEALAYLAEKNIPWREDSTNADTKFLRNRIRRLLIPLLNEHFPDWRTGLASLAATQSLAANYIHNEAAGRVHWQPLPENASRQDAITLFTDAETFFAQHAIIREEALFLGIDRLLAGNALSASVKRANIRRFSEGKVMAVDLGPLLLRRDARQVVLSGALRGIPPLRGEAEKPEASKRGGRLPPLFPDPQSEKGFSLLINTPGLYNLKGIAIDVYEYTGRSNENGVFLAQLPFVLRPSVKEDRINRSHAAGRYVLTAVDPLGPAAFIDFDGLVLCRDNGEAPKSADIEKRCMVKVVVKNPNDF